MEQQQHELYENARKILNQKKNLYYHFVVLVLGCLFLFFANVVLKYGAPTLWYIWVCVVWVFIFLYHFLRVFIINRFMNKDWEREQINQLILKQKTKIDSLESKVSKD